ncbi:MAG: serine hydrolase [Alphaproteobacteria bacterium]|mgnify:CR=1 FL=1|nr:serine hydrolase [Alphaproteobacteria bacterium]
MRSPRIKPTIGAVLIVFILLLQNFRAGTAMSADYWPTDGWRHSSPEDQGVAAEPLADLLAEIHEYRYRIDSVTVVRNGYLVLDSYFSPFEKGLKHIIHSDTKSFMSALIGIALDRGEIESVTQPVTGFFPGRVVANMDARKRSMTLEHLLTMTAGFDCKDSYRHRWVGLWEMRRSPDWAQHVLDLPMAREPGRLFDYCNGVSFLLSAILQQATGTSALDYARKHLFGPLGISDVAWPESPKGLSVGYGEMWLRPHDMAKFGWLYLNKGKWADRQIVSEAWVERSTRRHTDATLFDHYGYQWWRDASGYYMAVGYRGQFIFVVPRKNLVAVFTSDLDGAKFKVPRDLLTRHIIPAARSETALPADQAQQARLRELVKKTTIGPVEDIMWRSAEDGIVRDGGFLRTAAPGFKFSVPFGSRKMPLSTPNQVMRMQSPSGVRFGASVAEIPAGVALSDVGPRTYAGFLKALAKDVTVAGNRRIVLDDGTPAYKTELKWRYQGLDLTTHLVSVFREGKWIYLAAHPWREFNDAADIVGSLSFKRSN